jgi:NAD(P)-dependent dehydrogenase (short-subunit alcohol dehydrogenase family)
VDKLDQEFAGKVAVVTGAGSGIGCATALLLGNLGAKVHVADLNETSARVVAADIDSQGGRATTHHVDVSDPASVERLANAVYDEDGAVDILHNNAGVGHGGPVEDTSLEEWQRVLGVNLMGVVHGIHFFLPRMLAQGRPAHIVNTASMAGLVPVAEMAPYTTSKHAVVGLSESLNAELSPRGIHVSAICPGFIDTGIVAASHLQGGAAAQRSKVEAFYKRFGSSPDVVADAVVDAIRKKKLIRIVPRHHVALSWALRRISPRLAQGGARAGQRFTRGR